MQVQLLMAKWGKNFRDSEGGMRYLFVDTGHFCQLYLMHNYVVFVYSF